MIEATKTCPHCHQIIPNLEGVAVDVDGGFISYKGQRARLTDTQASVIKPIVEYGGAVISRGAIHERVWGNDPNGGPDVKVIDVHLYKARRELAKIGLAIHTHWGRGFSLVIDD